MPVHVLIRAGPGHAAAEILLDHRHRARYEVAQIVAQVAVHAVQKRLVGVVAVRAEGHFAHQVIAQNVGPVASHDGRGIFHVALGLAHLVAAEQQPAVAEHLPGQRQTQRVQHDGPVDGVEAHDFLAHQMNVRGPVLLKQAVIVRQIAQRGDVVAQRVDPHVHHVAGIEVHRHAPLEAGAADAQILKAGAQEVVQHLVGARRRLNEVRMGLDVVDDPVLILAHFEEIAFLAGQLHGAAAVRADLLAVLLLELRHRPEALARRAIVALVRALVNVALLVEFLEDLLNDLLVPFVGGADEVVILNVHQLPQILGLGDDLVHKLLRRYTRFLGLALDLLTVLVGSGEEIGVVAGHLLEPGHAVRRHGRVRVTDGHVAGRIIDRRRDIKLRFFHECIAPFHVKTPLAKREGRRCYAVPPCFTRLRGPLRRQPSAAPVTGRPAVRSLALAHRASEAMFPRAVPPAPTCPGSLNAQPPRYSLRPCLLCYYNPPNPTMSTPIPKFSRNLPEV